MKNERGTCTIKQDAKGVYTVSTCRGDELRPMRTVGVKPRHLCNQNRADVSWSSVGKLVTASECYAAMMMLMSAISLLKRYNGT